jgi:hypothetical protein
MSRRAAAWLAWSLWGLALCLVPVSLLFGIYAFSTALPEEQESSLVSIVIQDVLLVLYGTLVALISSRHRQNLIGWIFCFVAVSLGVLSVAYGHADYALYARDDSLPGVELAAWVTNW